MLRGFYNSLQGVLEGFYEQFYKVFCKVVYSSFTCFFVARLLDRFYKVFLQGFYNMFTGSFARFLQHFSRGVLQGFKNIVTRCFAMRLQDVYMVFCKAFTTVLQGVLQDLSLQSMDPRTKTLKMRKSLEIHGIQAYRIQNSATGT